MTDYNRMRHDYMALLDDLEHLRVKSERLLVNDGRTYYDLAIDGRLIAQYIVNISGYSRTPREPR